MNYYIFGAHSRGQTLGVYLSKLHTGWTNLGYLFDDDQENPKAVGDAPVYKIQGEEELDVSANVYLATRGISFAHIREVLEEYGFAPEKIIPVDPELDTRLRNEFVRTYYGERGWKFEKIEDVTKRLQDCSVLGHGSELVNVDCGGVKEDTELSRKMDGESLIYVVRSAVDAPLTTELSLKECEVYIQAGCALANSELVEVRCFDNIGDNISDKNRQMCELTALYWIWKNAGNSIIGLEHYRRRFILPDGWERVFSENMADVILPVPLFVNPSLKSNYFGRHEEMPWNVMLEEIGHIHGMECRKAAEDFFDNTGCYSPCNMLILRKEILDELCEWLFPVLFAVQDRCGILADNYQNRYPGFLSERLITFFFFMNRDKYKVLYADKSFLQ